MLTILETAIGGFHTLNTAVGFSGSLVTLYDHFKGNTHIKETLTAMRRQSKKAYEEYCRYRETVKEDIGVPLETDIVGYWESCMRRNILPSSDDMRIRKKQRSCSRTCWRPGCRSLTSQAGCMKCFC